MEFDEFVDKSCDSVCEVLTTLAREQKKITYKQLAKEADVPDADKPYVWFSYLPGLLDIVNRIEHEEGRPLLSAVVVTKGTGIPGDGFFDELAVGLGLLPAGASENEKRAFHEKELQKVYKVWADQQPTVEYEEFADKYFEPVYKTLPDIARARSMIAYSDLARRVGMPTDAHTLRDLVGWLLGEISSCEHQAGKPMLSAIVVTKEDGLPGSGFFHLAVDLGKLRAGANRKARMTFWRKELRRVYSAWAE